MSDDESAAAMQATPEVPPQIPQEPAEKTAPKDADAVPRNYREQIQTAPLNVRDVRPSWPTTIALLEQLSGWAVLALRLGTLALIQQCVRELSEPDARADLVVTIRALTDALAHMPLET